MQPIVERRDGAGGVVAASVEAAIHGPLDTVTGWLEQRGHGQGGAGHDQTGVAAKHLTEAKDHHGVAATQQHRQQPPGQGAADDPVQVIQPVANDGRSERRTMVNADSAMLPAVA